MSRTKRHVSAFAPSLRGVLLSHMPRNGIFESSKVLRTTSFLNNSASSGRAGLHEGVRGQVAASASALMFLVRISFAHF